MKWTTTLILLFILVSSAAAEQPAKLGKLLSKKYLEMNNLDQTIILITFTDKGNNKHQREINAGSLLSQRSINRRLKVRDNSHVIDEQDLPLERSYVNTVSRNTVQIRHELRWFNALSVVATKTQIDILQNLPFVKEIELVGRWKKRIGDEEEQSIKNAETLRAPSGTTSLDYGTSYTQVSQLKVPQVHDLGIYGQGVVVGVFDNGFRILNHESFASMNIVAQYDFVDHKVSVIPNNTNTGFGSHGVNTLSTIGGYKPGQLIGPAFKADYILARTENDSSETPIEEDNWAKAIEWADSIGVDVTSTSLGYNSYDSPYTSWTWADMDGNTTLITRAADRAVGLGIVVVNSAGNAGAGDGVHNTLGAPSDGDSVIAAGAVYSNGSRVSFSSVGPTADGRTKPDIMAMGSGVKVASSTNTTGYGLASGTSFSCPLSGGVAALILCANPMLTPMQIREAMRQTASNAETPDNLMGWGILNTDSAIKYFGALPSGRISGMKFNDINGNGVKDAGEPALTGAKIYLSGTVMDSAVTDGLGNYSFDSLAIGNYTLSEKVPSGWEQTLPAEAYSVNLLHAVDTAQFNFGNFQLGKLHGLVFADSNKNGVQDSGENGLANWIIYLSGTGSYSTQTDQDGAYSFIGIEHGTYTLSESSEVDWYQTIPLSFGTYSVTLYSGFDSSGFIFGNVYIQNFGMAVHAGWNLFSLPYSVTDNHKATIYPTAISDIFTYTTSYASADTIPLSQGYWIKFASSQNFFAEGIPRLLDTIEVRAGWNIIGSLSVPVLTSSIIQIPENNVISQYYSYTQSYTGVTSLFPYYGYWVKVKENGKLILNGETTISSMQKR